MNNNAFSKNLSIVILFMISCWMITNAQDYLKVYRNGQKVNEFYTTEVDSIVISPQSKGNGYNVNYWTSDTTFTIPQAELDSTVFGTISIDEISNEIERASKVAGRLFSQCSTIKELVSHIEEIRNTDGVENVRYTDETVFVKLKGWGTIQYCYPPQMPASENIVTQLELDKFSRALSSYSIHNYMNIKSVCIANWFSTNHDSGYNYARRNATLAKSMFTACNFNTTEKSPTPDFLTGEIYNYDIVFLITHGGYDPCTGLHWLATSQEIGTDYFIPKEEAYKMLTNRKMQLNQRGMTIMCFHDYRNNGWCNVYYYGVSNNYIASRGGAFSNHGKTIVFNAACKSLKGNYNLAYTFFNKGAGIYFGYDDSNNLGPGAGADLFLYMLNGMSVQKAIKEVRSDGYDPDPYCKAHLYGALNPSVKDARTLSLVKTEMGEIKDGSENEKMAIKVKGSVKLFQPSAMDHTYGFYLSEREDFESGKILPGMKKGSKGCDISNNTVLFEQTLTDNELEPGKKYYICPYLYDGESYCLAEKLESFSTSGVVTLDVGYAKADIAQLQGQFICGNAVEEAGFQIGMSEDLTSFIEIKVGEASSLTQANYWSVITGLHPSKTYYYKSYVVVDGNKICGNTVSFRTSWEIDGEITSYTQKSSAYYISENNDFVGITANIQYKAPMMSAATTQWGVYMDNYNNSGNVNGWASSAGISSTQDSQDISVAIVKNWFDSRNFSSFQAIKKAKMGVYKIVQYDGGTDIFYSAPREIAFVYDQKPYMEFLTWNCKSPVTATDPYDGKEKWKTNVYGNYYVNGSFWVNKLDFVIESGDANDHVGTWTIKGDGTKEYSINCYTSKNIEVYNSKFRFDMILEDGSRVPSANSITLTVTSKSRMKERLQELQIMYSNESKGETLTRTLNDGVVDLRAIKPFRFGVMSK